MVNAPAPSSTPPAHALTPLWDARSVAIVGATERAGALGRLPVAFLQRYGYRGRILPVNPRSDTVLGLPAHPTVAAARESTGEPVDLAMIMVGADRVPDAIDDCIAGGRAGRDRLRERLRRDRRRTGAALQDEVVRRARAGGVRGCSGRTASARSASTPGQVASFSPLFAGRDDPTRSRLDRLRQPERRPRVRRGEPRVRARPRSRLGREHRQRGRRHRARGA